MRGRKMCVRGCVSPEVDRGVASSAVDSSGLAVMT